ncbi:hypothetical protein AMTR_s00109p00107640 [Amborella trichopoda]|uniref:Uncharacterized protein n=1 Tax=Amborella trichopoda TaxID=13333 RepID=W1NRZ5_AMBTC|nr:hypothetical protein AMTR_s00109p00107640 [Amborella trichopoda]
MATVLPVTREMLIKRQPMINHFGPIAMASITSSERLAFVEQAVVGVFLQQSTSSPTGYYFCLDQTEKN